MSRSVQRDQAARSARRRIPREDGPERVDGVDGELTERVEGPPARRRIEHPGGGGARPVGQGTTIRPSSSGRRTLTAALRRRDGPGGPRRVAAGGAGRARSSAGRPPTSTTTRSGSGRPPAACRRRPRRGADVGTPSPPAVEHVDAAGGRRHEDVGHTGRSDRGSSMTERPRAAALGRDGHDPARVRRLGRRHQQVGDVVGADGHQSAADSGMSSVNGRGADRGRQHLGGGVVDHGDPVGAVPHAGQAVPRTSDEVER